MLRILNISKSYEYFIFLVLTFFVADFLIENLNDRFWLNDFKVYYDASSAFVEHQNPYGTAYGLSSGYYKYSPFTLITFIPYTWFGFDMAKNLHFLLIIFCGLGSFLLAFILISYSALKEISFRKNALGLILLMCAAVHLSREVHLGNINLVLIFLVLGGLWLNFQQRPVWAALFFGLTVLIKPYFLILVLPFIIARNWKLILYSIIITLILAVLPILFLGFDGLIELYHDWVNSMGLHGEAAFSEHTISSIIWSYTGIKLASHWQYLIILIVGTGYLIYRYRIFIDRKSNSFLLFDALCLLALIPNLVITDSQHFLFSIPLIAYVLVLLKENQSLFHISLFIVLIFFYGLNSNDLLGNPLSDKFDAFSTIGLANLGIILFAIYLNRKTRLQLLSGHTHED